MSERNFRQLLEAQWDRGNFVCVGLDSEFEKIPKAVETACVFDRFVFFNRHIVNATKDLVCAFKLNAAFYLAKGAEGLGALWETCCYIRQVAPTVPIIIDVKQADIGNTNAGYVTLDFDWLEADAVTVHPYLGQEALQPFLDRKDKGIIVLCQTSNRGAGEFQNLSVGISREEVVRLSSVGVTSLFMGIEGAFTSLSNHVAYQVSNYWNKNENCMLVVGATYPSELQAIRQIVGDMPILIPGIGAQGGDLEKTVIAGKDSRGRGMIINSSRGIIFASQGEDFAEAARRETLKLHTAINKCREYVQTCPDCGDKIILAGMTRKCLNCGKSV